MSLVPKTFDETMRLVTTLGVVISFIWGVYQWRAAAEASARQAELEARKPFLTRQLELYGEATKTAASLAVSRSEEADRKKLETRFWELYWGELGLVENADVEAAMVAYGAALKDGANVDQMRPLSLELAHAIRRSLDKSWGTTAWEKRE